MDSNSEKTDQQLAALIKLLQSSQEQVAAQQRQIDQLLKVPASSSDQCMKKDSELQIIDTLAKSIEPFNSGKDVKFGEWYKRFQDVFGVDGKDLSDSAKTRLLLRKLDTISFTQYADHILPEDPKEVEFKKTVETLQELFGSQESQFAKRLKCLRVEKSDLDDFVAYSGKINRLCEDFKIRTITADEFKALIFIVGLKKHRYSDIVTHLLNKLETTEESKVNLTLMTTESNRLVNLISDTARVKRDQNHVIASSKSYSQSPKKPTLKPNSRSSTPSSACFLCGEMHFSKFCPFKKHLCKKCDKIGHKESHCHSRERQRTNLKISHLHANNALVFDRKYITVTINGTEIRLQFDSASDLTIISHQNWVKLNSPALSPVDLVVRDAQYNQMNLLGQFDCTVKLNGQIQNTNCFVSPIDVNLFGI